jgi:GNAT superfamily N-acetyltransferase
MATGSSPIIRAASPDDSIAMAAVVRAAASPLMRETTILGGVGLDRFIRDQIASESANRFLVAEVGGHIVGMSAWRYEGEELFLNHLFVHPSAQGRRVGTSLWARGLAVMQHRRGAHPFAGRLRGQYASRRLVSLIGPGAGRAAHRNGSADSFGVAHRGPSLVIDLSRPCRPRL